VPGWLEIQVTVLPALPEAGVECDTHPEFPKPLLTRSSEPRALSPVRAVTLGQKHTVAADSCADDLTAEFPTLLLYAREFPMLLLYAQKVPWDLLGPRGRNAIPTADHSEPPG
jgi:hypothetical protein